MSAQLVAPLPDSRSRDAEALVAAGPAVELETLADLLERLGDIPLQRIRAHPPIGSATERDLLARDGEKPILELVDGVLVEKAMGFYESRLAAVLLHYLETFLESHDLGIVLGADGLLRLWPGLVRAPDVSFISWRHFPDRQLPAEPQPDLPPDLAVEIISKSNTRREMERKLHEYFEAGAVLVWFVYPDTRSARVYSTPADYHDVPEAGALDGGTVLPGFSLSLQQLFHRAGQRAPQN